MPTTREVLDTTIALERESMAIYARFAKIFSAEPALHDFWFGMARDEARHVGALHLVATVLDLEGQLDRPSPVAMRDATVRHVQELMASCGRDDDAKVSIERALMMALEVEETELEDLVSDLLKALQKRDEYESCMRMLVHDLGELSYMIEQHCQDPAMLQRCDALVNRHAEGLCAGSAAHSG
jgi:rubrerythrin